MTQIVLTPEQAEVLAKADGPVIVVDASGKTIGQLPASSRYAAKHFTDEEIKAIEARIGNDGPYVTTAELLANLRALGSSQCDTP